MSIVSLDVKIERKKNGIKIENLERYLKSLAQSKLSIGVHKEAGADLVKRAKHTEFGTQPPNAIVWYEEGYGSSGIVPPRPIIRMYLYPEMLNGISKAYKQGIKMAKSVKMKDADRIAENTLNLVGQVGVSLQKEQVFLRNYDTSTNKSPFDPNYNGDKTIKYKGFDLPWIGTGQTVEAINYKVTRKGS